MGELGETYRGIESYLREQRQQAVAEPVTKQADRKARRIFARGRMVAGRCTKPGCYDPRAHLHGAE